MMRSARKILLSYYLGLLSSQPNLHGYLIYPTFKPWPSVSCQPHRALLLEPEFAKAAETHKGTMTPSSTWLAGSPWFLHPSLLQFQMLP